MADSPFRGSEVPVLCSFQETMKAFVHDNSGAKELPDIAGEKKGMEKWLTMASTGG